MEVWCARCVALGVSLRGWRCIPLILWATVDFAFAGVSAKASERPKQLSASGCLRVRPVRGAGDFGMASGTRRSPCRRLNKYVGEDALDDKDYDKSRLSPETGKPRPGTWVLRSFDL
ncbi:hypothetical protein DFH09DRAFT_184342 [Mycena vulgaris]|nr:hypothetical protein DFH09DRAFT_184342 [Mycena vulgaris]